tara:strand:- start:1257 stop:2465 length:1209 start_codon:yes stop_codon:yes gene_type:complete
MGPGFGGINLGGFALPDLNMDEINAGIASQVAQYLAEQELAEATNEYEKDAAETKIEQVNEFQTGLGSLPPVVEEIMQTFIMEPDRYDDIRNTVVDDKVPFEDFPASPNQFDTIEAISDRDFPTFVEPSAPLPPSIETTIEQIIENSLPPAQIVPESESGIPSMVDPGPSTSIVDPVIESVSDINFPTFTEPSSSIDTYNPNYMSGEDERFIAIQNEAPYRPDSEVILAEDDPPRSFPITGEDLGLPMGEGIPMPAGTIIEGDPIRLPEMDPNFTRIVQSPVSNLIQQQRAAYNSALQNAVYNPQPQQQQAYVRPMSAAEFGSRPGQEPVTTMGTPNPNMGTPDPSTDLGYPSPNLGYPPPELEYVRRSRGGALNSGLGGLPPMQQNDKLTQLFAQSFRPRR